MKKKILFFIIALLSPMMVNALNCSDEEYANVSKLASNVKLSYEYKIDENNNITYVITFSNLTSDMRILDNKLVKIYQGFRTGKDFSHISTVGGSYNYEIYSIRCASKLTNKTIHIPSYNKLAIDKRCNGLEEYNVCNRWSSYTADEEKFEKDLKAAKEDYKKRNETKIDNSKREYTFMDQLIRFVAKYLIIIVGILLILILIVNLLYKKHKEKTEFNFKL